MSDDKHNWAADIAICEHDVAVQKAGQPPFLHDIPPEDLTEEQMDAYNDWWDRDSLFATAARTGWPLAIREAMRVPGLKAAVEQMCHTIRVLMEHVFPSAGVPIGALSVGEEIVRLQDSCLDGWRSRAEKAEADAAALREELRKVVRDEVYRELARAEALLAAAPSEEVGK